MTDPVKLQRQLHAATERARELEARLDHLEERFAELRAQSMSGHADLTRMVRVEHALHLAGFSGFAPVRVDVAIRATMGDVQAPSALTGGDDG